MFEYGRFGMKHLVTRVGAFEDITACDALDPEACASPRSIMVIACIAKAEGINDMDLGVWLFSHRNRQHNMRGATLIACQTGLRAYAPSVFTMYEATDAHRTFYDPVNFEQAHKACFVGMYSLHGTVTTKFMGATTGYPNWDFLRAELTRRRRWLFKQE